MRRLAWLLAALAPCPALAADVIAATPSRAADGTWGFDVTVRSDDTGWDAYADRWEVVAPDGTVLGTRELLHPHEDEQPFRRSLTGVTIPAAITRVTVRAHDKPGGFGGAELAVTLP